MAAEAGAEAAEVAEEIRSNSGDIEKSTATYEGLIEEAKKSVGQAEKSVKAELQVKAQELAREILDKFSQDATDKQAVIDCLKSITDNPSVENTYRQVKILEGRRSFSSLKALYESASDTLSRALDFNSDSNLKRSLLDKIKLSVDNGTMDKASVDRLNSAVSTDMATVDEKATSDGTKDEIESKSSLPWKVVLFLVCCGSLVGALFLISSALSGCYQYKVGKDAFQLNSCTQFYSNKDNQPYCSCPTGLVTTPDCNGADANYPYCKCPEIRGQVCVDGANMVYYGYTDYNPFTLLKDIAKTVINAAKDGLGGLGDLLTTIKKYGLIVGVVILVIITLNILLKFAPSGGGGGGGESGGEHK
jgi:hypothetical protein